MNGYELSRYWWDFCFDNPEKIKPNHAALYFFAIEHCNRLGWKEKFGLPTTMAKEAIGIRSYTTYISTLNDLVKWGFLTMVEKSKNQYSSNIVALSKFNKAHNKALGKAIVKHDSKQVESIVSIDKPLTINHKHNSVIPKNIKGDLREAIHNFIGMRSEIKKPMTIRAIELLIIRLQKLSKSEKEQIEILNNSIEVSWANIYPLKVEKNMSEADRSMQTESKNILKIG